MMSVTPPPVQRPLATGVTVTVILFSLSPKPDSSSTFLATVKVRWSDSPAAVLPRLTGALLLTFASESNSVARYSSISLCAWASARARSAAPALKLAEKRKSEMAPKPMTIAMKRAMTVSRRVKPCAAPLGVSARGVVLLLGLRICSIPSVRDVNVDELGAAAPGGRRHLDLELAAVGRAGDGFDGDGRARHADRQVAVRRVFARGDGGVEGRVGERRRDDGGAAALLAGVADADGRGLGAGRRKGHRALLRRAAGGRARRPGGCPGRRARRARGRAYRRAGGRAYRRAR